MHTYPIIQQLNIHEIKEKFARLDRDYYSLEGLKAIIEREIQLMDENGDTAYDLDVIAINCIYTEYDEKGFINDYSNWLADYDLELDTESEDFDIYEVLDAIEMDNSVDLEILTIIDEDENLKIIVINP